MARIERHTSVGGGGMEWSSLMQAAIAASRQYLLARGLLDDQA